MYIRSTIDPITGRDVPNPEEHPCVFQGDGDNGVEVYFESEETRQMFLDMDREEDHKIVLQGNDSDEYVAEG